MSTGGTRGEDIRPKHFAIKNPFDRWAHVITLVLIWPLAFLVLTVIYPRILSPMASLMCDGSLRIGWETIEAEPTLFRARNGGSASITRLWSHCQSPTHGEKDIGPSSIGLTFMWSTLLALGTWSLALRAIGLRNFVGVALTLLVWPYLVGFTFAFVPKIELPIAKLACSGELDLRQEHLETTTLSNQFMTGSSTYWHRALECKEPTAFNIEAVFPMFVGLPPLFALSFAVIVGRLGRVRSSEPHPSTNLEVEN